MKRFILFHGKRHPKNMSAVGVEAFLSYFAVERNVSASTQNQAKSALLFLYKEVLEIDLPWLENITTAKTSQRLPVVLTEEEVRRVLGQLEGTLWLIISLLYGTGMRLMECVRLRVRDVEFSRGEILVREGKGFKDRVTLLPNVLVEPLKQHLVRMRELHRNDVTQGFGTVYLPYALENKYPGAAAEWGWQYVFPARSLSTDLRSGEMRRHHIDEKQIQRTMKRAVQQVGIAKPATPHTLRHSFATHLRTRQ